MKQFVLLLICALPAIANAGQCVLRQSTASQSILIGPFVDETDGSTAETGLSIANTDIRLSANGGNMASKNSGGGTHDENGMYQITLDATDTATVGLLQISVAVSGALPVWEECRVVEENVYDAIFASGADLGTNIGSPSDLGSGATLADNLADIGAEVLATGTCDSGSTTTCVDAALTQGDNYWNNSILVMTSGNAVGQARCISDFVASSDTVYVAPAFSGAVSTDTYVILAGACK